MKKSKKWLLKGQGNMKTTWWNGQVTEQVKEKRLLYKEWQKNRSYALKKLYLAKKRS